MCKKIINKCAPKKSDNTSYTGQTSLPSSGPYTLKLFVKFLEMKSFDTNL